LIVFPAKVKGKEERLSVTIPTKIARDYGLRPGDFVIVTLKDNTRTPELYIQFRKRIAKAGSMGTLIYIPKKLYDKYELKYYLETDEHGRKHSLEVILEEF